MSTECWTLIDEDEPREVELEASGERLLVSSAALAGATGWTLKAEGLCRDERCVAVGEDAAIGDAAALDLAAVAQALGRPLAIDLEHRAACLGGSASERAGALTGLEAPDFTLPDLTGRMHSLSDYRGKKILLAAYSSW